MTPRAPLAKRRQATAVSSTSMRSWASVAVKPLMCVDRPHHPQQQIDVVDGLVHQGAAAVERLRALPAALVVVRLRPPPFAGRLAQRQPAEAAGLDGLPSAPGWRRRSATGRWCRACTPLLVAGLDDAVAALQRDFQRLLDDDVLAGLRRGDGRLQVRAARRGDDDDVDVRPGQHRVEVGRRRRSRQSELVGHLLGVGGAAADQGDQPRPGTSARARAWKRAIMPQPTMAKPSCIRGCGSSEADCVRSVAIAATARPSTGTARRSAAWRPPWPRSARRGRQRQSVPVESEPSGISNATKMAITAAHCKPILNLPSQSAPKRAPCVSRSCAGR